MQETYRTVAREFSKLIDSTFETEETLKAVFLKYIGELEFTRTDFWNIILDRMLTGCWVKYGPEVTSVPTGYDRLAILRELQSFLDYNLFTQVLLNLQMYTGMAYQTKDAEKELQRLQESWPKTAKLNPFEPKAKMVKIAATDEEKQYNMVLSTMRSLKIISQFTPQISFRVTPLQQTPAFADSRNISMMGIGADQYLKTLPNLKVFYISWEPRSNPQMANHFTYANVLDGTTGFQAEGIPYPFFSKSGGGILNEVLFARKIMAEVFAAHDVTAESCILIPRMNSVMIVADQYGHHVKKAFEQLVQKYPMLNLSEGTRA